MSKRRTQKAISLLKDAQELLAESDWAQSAFYSEPHRVYRLGEGMVTTNDAYCAIGAVNRSAWFSSRFTLRTPTVMKAIRALGMSVVARAANNPLMQIEDAILGLNNRQRVIRYNDKWAHCKSQVISLFGDAIERLNSELGDESTMERRIDAASDQRVMELAGGPE